MADGDKTAATTPGSSGPGAAQMLELPIEQELQESYLTYAMSVIVSRALPDVRDGLKPSQRRILVAMHDLDLGPASHHRKCAKICGDTSGNYHPHGEGVIYPTLVRLAQPFNMRCMLVDGQGNFGSIDGYPAAAMRYTEARLTRFAAEMLEDVGPETVDFIPNYDETRTEPTVLPSKFPNLLVNGSSGIAVGMATSIPPHNLGEVCEALVHLIENPECSIEDLMKLVPGPDFPTGGIICGRAGLGRAYRTGRGRAVVRSRLDIEEGKGDRKSIVVTEIPYQIQKRILIERVAEVVKSGVVTGVSDVVDESDREGMRIVIKLSPGADENIVLNQLYKHTQLQDTFSINMIALVGGKPQTLNLKELLELFRDHRVDVITRRTRRALRLAEERKHDLEGLLIAIEHIDAIIALIRAAATVDAAREELIRKYELSRRQADVVLGMRLSRLVALEREKLDADFAKVTEQIADYKAILGDPLLVLDIVKEDVHELREKYADDRRTELSGAVVELGMEDLVAIEPMAVTISHAGYLKRMKLSTYRSQRRGGKGVIGASTRESDFTEHLAVSSTHDTLLFFSDQGRVYWQRVFELPLLGRVSAGRPIGTVLKLKENERVTSLIAVAELGGGTLAMATEKGKLKRTDLAEFSNPRPSGLIAIKLAEGDRLVGVVRTTDEDELLLATAGGQAVRFKASDARPMGRASAGVTGVKLREGDRVVSLVRADEGLDVVTLSERGYGKRTPIEDYRLTRRGGSGVVNMKVSARTGDVVATLAAAEEDEVLVMTANGLVVRTSVGEIRQMGRSVQGVRVMTPKKKDRVIAAARVEAESEDEGPEGDDHDEELDEDIAAEAAGEDVAGELAEGGDGEE
ncbi:MAG: DNA gyrase subunit A [Planctomycetota bacterium]|jgi:DNA gyrase subunit A